MVDSVQQNREFKAESKRLLDLMINSVYTNKEIFLRELISNSSDALDKLHFISLTDSSATVDVSGLKIILHVDKQARVLSIVDNGIGMTDVELDVNLGTIAKSGSRSFKQDLSLKNDANKSQIDIIGQFGVGFYSAFMVAETVTVLSFAHGADVAYEWQSSGLDGYSMRQVSMEEFDQEFSNVGMFGTSGTVVKLQLKSDASDSDDEFRYDNFLESYTLSSIVKKYSDYIRYPIQTQTYKVNKSGDDSVENVEFETLNSQIPLWKKNKSKVTEEQYSNFYKEKFFDTNVPLKHIVSKIEGIVEFDTLLYIPSAAPYNYFAKDYQKGLQLYASGVLITDKCSELLPDYFGFVKGVVDSNDLSLNISREVLQKDQQLKKISTALEKKIRQELLKLKTGDRETYLKFFEVFGLTLKFGAYDGFGVNKDKLVNLLMFFSSTQKQLVDFKEYVSRMKPDQKHIYYATGDSYAKLDKLPASDQVRDAGFEILYLKEAIDEFCIKIVDEFDGKKFMSVTSPNLDLPNKVVQEQDNDVHGELLQAVQKELSEKVVEVKLSTRLKTHACCLSSKGDISIEMEKVFAAMPDKSRANIKAQKVLELNANHKIFEKLSSFKEQGNPDFGKLCRVLYATARIVEGLSVEDSVSYSEDVLDLV